ncbi:MAG TPA: hypothetical protein VHO50_08050, partial [Bacteroidales bacterium]|nr:hypothetical protein [Bacteroidales bacterium]
MKKQFNKSGKVILSFLALMYCTEVNCQILKDTTTVMLVKTGIEDIYRSKFGEAENILQVIEKKFPGHPATDLYSAILTYYRYYPLIPSGPGFKNFELNIQDCINKCEEDKNWMDDPEMVLINVSA